MFFICETFNILFVAFFTTTPIRQITRTKYYTQVQLFINKIAIYVENMNGDK